MMGTPTHDDPGSFWQADVGTAARLPEVLTDERADALTVYDENGMYGHPDHIQVHRVGLRAADLANGAADVPRDRGGTRGHEGGRHPVSRAKRPSGGEREDL